MWNLDSVRNTSACKQPESRIASGFAFCSENFLFYDENELGLPSP